MDRQLRQWRHGLGLAHEYPVILGWFVSHLKYAFNLDLWPVGEAAAFL